MLAPAWQVVVCGAVGLLLLVLAGELIVDGARDIALAFGLGEFVVGATIVAIGTSAPELATTLVARLRGHDDIGLGTILGSNLFNGLCVVGVAAAIHPVAIAGRDLGLALLFGIAAVACTWPGAGGRIGRRHALLLLALYGIYIALVMRDAGA